MTRNIGRPIGYQPIFGGDPGSEGIQPEQWIEGWGGLTGGTDF